MLRSGEAITTGAINAEVVVSETVSDPCATRKQVAIKKAATITGIPVLANSEESTSPIPQARSTPPNIPPAPVTKITAQIGPNDFSHNNCRSLALN